MEEEQIMKIKEEKDLGVIMEENLNLYKYMTKIFGLSYKMLTNIRMAFHYMHKDMMKKIITSMIRPRLEYAAVVWSPRVLKRI